MSKQPKPALIPNPDQTVEIWIDAAYEAALKEPCQTLKHNNSLRALFFKEGDLDLLCLRAVNRSSNSLAPRDRWFLILPKGVKANEPGLF